MVLNIFSQQLMCLQCQNIMECFKDILNKCGDKPKRLHTDRGSEMICKQFREFLKRDKNSPLFRIQSKKVSCCREVQFNYTTVII